MMAVLVGMRVAAPADVVRGAGAAGIILIAVAECGTTTMDCGYWFPPLLNR